MENLGFEKIELKNTDSEVADSNKKTNTSSKSRLSFVNKKVLLGFIVLILALFGFLGYKAKIIYDDSKKVYAQVKIAADAVKKQNIIVAKEELVKTQAGIKIVKEDLDSLSFLGFIPIVNFYYNDASHMVNASLHGISAGVKVTDSLIPYADVLGLKGEKSFVAGSAQDRIQLAVKTMGKVVPNIDLIEKDLDLAKEEIDKVDENHYPEMGQLKEVKGQIRMVKSIVDESVVAMQQARPLIKVLPSLLGESETKKYLVIFQNDKELRPTGGFITFYTVLRVEQGVIHVDSASDIYNLDNSIPSHPKAPEIILKYLPKVYTFNMRDSNLSPDYVESMKTFYDFYGKSSLKSTKIDGIIALDTQVLVHVLEILGDVSASGMTFSSKNDKKCDCPQVVYQLELEADKPVNRVRDSRKAIIGELLFAIMNKAFSSSPKLYWGRLFQQALKDTQEKHILFYTFNKDAQSGIEALNFGGRIREFDGDYLHINNSNFGGAKSNMYVKDSVKVDYEIAQDGKIVKTVTIDYKNSHPPSDCNLERGNLCLNAILRNYLRVYVPKGSVLIDSKGSEVKVGTKEDLGKTVFDAFLTVRPLGKSQISFKYQLPFKLDESSSLPFMIQKQPGTDGTIYEIMVKGAKKEGFVLDVDKTLNLKGF